MTAQQMRIHEAHAGVLPQSVAVYLMLSRLLQLPRPLPSRALVRLKDSADICAARAAACGEPPASAASAATAAAAQAPLMALAAAATRSMPLMLAPSTVPSLPSLVRPMLSSPPLPSAGIISGPAEGWKVRLRRRGDMAACETVDLALAAAAVGASPRASASSAPMLPVVLLCWGRAGRLLAPPPRSLLPPYSLAPPSALLVLVATLVATLPAELLRNREGAAPGMWASQLARMRLKQSYVQNANQWCKMLAV